MAVVGKMEVDLYANPTPFISGLRAGEAAAKKSAAGIGASIDKINRKQMTNIAGNMVKAFGVAGLADKAFRIGAEFMNEFTRGGNFSAAFDKISTQLQESLSSTPVLGAAFELGKAIGDYLTDGAMSAEEAQQKSRIEATKKQKKFIEDLREEENKKIRDEEQAQINAGLEKEKEEKDESDKSLEAFWATRDDAANKILDLEKKAKEISMSKRDILLQELREMENITIEEIDRGMFAFDTLEAHEKQKDALEKLKDEQKALNEEAEKAQEDLQKAQVDFQNEEARLNEQAEKASSGTTLDTAIGSVKIEGATDFSIEKQLETAKGQLEAAETSAELLKIIAGQLGGSV